MTDDINTIAVSQIKQLAARWAAVEAVSYRMVHNSHGQDDIATTDKGREIGRGLYFAATGWANGSVYFAGRAAELNHEADQIAEKGTAWALGTRGIFDHEAADMIARYSANPERIVQIILGRLGAGIDLAEEIANR